MWLIEWWATFWCAWLGPRSPLLGIDYAEAVAQTDLTEIAEDFAQGSAREDGFEDSDAP